MAKSLGTAIIIGIILLLIGLIIGYVIFGRTSSGKFIPITRFLGVNTQKTKIGKELNNLKNDVKDFFTGTNISQKRINIIICGGAGLLLGVLIGVVAGKRR